MKLKFFLISLFLDFGLSQITFPDATTTTPPTTMEATEETTEEEVTMEETSTVPEEMTTMPEDATTSPSVTEPPPQMGGITICTPVDQCTSIDGVIPTNDGSGKMDVRINNNGKRNGTIGTMIQITTPEYPGAPTVVQNQTTCNSQSELCLLPNGYKCGIGFQDYAGLPKIEGAAPYIGYPWQGLVMRNDPEDLYTFYASGCLITHRHFITVANKVTRFVNNNQAIKVRMGEWNLAAPMQAKPLKPMDFNVSAVFIHDFYNDVTLSDNIALLLLASDVPLGVYPHISTACIPKDDVTQANVRCMVAGWGKSFKLSDANFVLRDVDQPVLTTSYCQDTLRTSILGPDFNLDTYSWICAGGEANKSNCDGDGGNPLVCNITGQWYVVGLASWGTMDQMCGLKPLPELYVNVNYEKDWIIYILSQVLARRRSTTTMKPSNVTTTTRLGSRVTTTPSNGFSTPPRSSISPTTSRFTGFTTKPKTTMGTGGTRGPSTTTTPRLGGRTTTTTTTVRTGGSGFTTKSRTTSKGRVNNNKQAKTTRSSNTRKSSTIASKVKSQVTTTRNSTTTTTKATTKKKN